MEVRVSTDGPGNSLLGLGGGTVHRARFKAKQYKSPVHHETCQVIPHPSLCTRDSS